jgi:type IV secretory pathway VirJ component
MLTRYLLAILLLTPCAARAVENSPGAAATPGAAAKPGAAANPGAVAPVVQHLSHGRFHAFPVYSPAAAPSSVVLLVSGNRGWDAASAALAHEFAQRGALVIGIDQPKLDAALRRDPSDCVLPDGDLENLSHFVQAYLHLATYFTPLLVGEGTGGAFVYALLAQAPKDTFGGALSLGFCPQLDLRKALCDKNTALRVAPRGRDRFELLPAAAIPAPWTVVAAAPDASAKTGPSCTLEATRQFVDATRGATLVTVPRDQGRHAQALWNSGVEQAFAELVAGLHRSEPPLPPAVLGDLPVVEVAASGRADSRNADAFAIMMSGDGGWAGIDQGVAAALSAAGVPVVGLDSLRYYWSARTPAGLAADTDRMIRYYRTHFGRHRVVLIGYSQGADTLPFAVNRLPSATRATVALVALLGVSAHALFEFHVTSWVSDDDSGPATVPEIRQMTGLPVLCVYGADEADSPCRGLSGAGLKGVELPGGHHFDGDYAGLAARILAALPTDVHTP